MVSSASSVCAGRNADKPEEVATRAKETLFGLTTNPASEAGRIHTNVLGRIEETADPASETGFNGSSK